MAFTYTYKGKEYKAVIVTVGGLSVPAQYIGREGRYELWLGVDEIIYFY